MSVNPEAQSEALSGPIPSERTPIAVLLCVLAALYAVFAANTYAGSGGLYDGLGILIGRDFVVFWTASVLALAGEMTEIFDLAQFQAAQISLVGPPVLEAPVQDAAPAAQHSYPWLYPPQMLFYVLPLGLLPYLWSYGLWCAATLALYLLAVQYRRWSAAETAVLVLAPATMVNLFMGQNGLLSAALLIGGLRLLDRRPVLAGVLLGLLCFKPQLGLLLPIALLAARLWRPFFGAAATVAAVMTASLVVFGPESWRAYLDVTMAQQSRLLAEDSGWFLDIAITPLMSARTLGLAPWLGGVLQGVLTLAVILGVYATFRKTADRRLQCAVLLAGVFLASPYGYHYDLPLVSVAVLWAYRAGLEAGFLPGEKVLLVLVWLLPLLVVGLNPAGLPVTPLILLAFFVLLLARANGWTDKLRRPA